MHNVYLSFHITVCRSGEEGGEEVQNECFVKFGSICGEKKTS